jgi:hypothetical protein
MKIVAVKQDVRDILLRGRAVFSWREATVRCINAAWRSSSDHLWVGFWRRTLEVAAGAGGRKAGRIFRYPYPQCHASRPELQSWYHQIVWKILSRVMVRAEVVSLPTVLVLSHGQVPAALDSEQGCKAET